MELVGVKKVVLLLFAKRGGPKNGAETALNWAPNMVCTEGRWKRRQMDTKYGAIFKALKEAI